MSCLVRRTTSGSTPDTTRIAGLASSSAVSVPSGSLPAVPKANPATENRDYEARHLLVLEGLEAVRKRPAMYIGSTDTRGLMHCLWEIIDNAVDEALGGFGNEILITLRPDGGISVHDQGRGIPVDIEPRTGLSGVEVVFTKLHAGGKFGAGSYNATGGLHGVGASVVNALSSRLDVEVDRNGSTYAMSFRRGVPGAFDGPGPTAKFTPGGSLAKSRPGREGSDRHPDHLLAGPADLPAGGPAVAQGPAGPGAADQLPGARPRPHRGRRPDQGGHRGDLPARRRDLGVLRVPGAGPGDHRRGPAARAEPVHRDRADAGRRRAHGADRRRPRPRRRHRGALGRLATTPRSSPTSTSSPRRRAAPTSPASSGR